MALRSHTIARFRIKKKQWTLNLERSITDLSGRVEELEREAAADGLLALSRCERMSNRDHGKRTRFMMTNISARLEA